MLVAALIVFALAAILGVILAATFVMKTSAPMWLAYVHAALGILGVILLIIGVAGGQTGGLIVAALVVFLLTAVGGIVIYALGSKGRPIPSALLVVHGAAGLVAFILLLVGRAG